MKTAVLVVDDEPMMRKLVRAILERSGLDVLDAAGGMEACRLFTSARERIGLVLTDIVMPDMDGITLAVQLRAISPATPILFMTGYAGRLKDAPGRVLMKPFTSAVLVREVRKELEAAA